MKKIIILFCTFFAFNSYANLVFSPYLGGHFGNVKLEDNIEGDLSGFGLGGRLTYDYLGFFGGVDLKFSALESDYPAKSYEQNQAGIIGGVAFPFAPIKVWAGFYFLDIMNISQEDSTYYGGAYSFGISLTPLPLFAFNLEYLGHSYSEKKLSNGTENKISDATVNTLYLSLSFNFESKIF